MKEIHIEIKPFFDLLKQHERSMWDIFAHLLTDEPQKVLFINEKNEVEFDYIMPNNLSDLKEDQKKFSEAFKKKIERYDEKNL